MVEMVQIGGAALSQVPSCCCGLALCIRVQPCCCLLLVLLGMARAVGDLQICCCPHKRQQTELCVLTAPLLPPPGEQHQAAAEDPLPVLPGHWLPGLWQLHRQWHGALYPHALLLLRQHRQGDVHRLPVHWQADGHGARPQDRPLCVRRGDRGRTRLRAGVGQALGVGRAAMAPVRSVGSGAVACCGLV